MTKKSVLINYRGGFSGNFFTHLLAECLGVDHIHSSNKYNAHFYNSKEIQPKFIKTFGKLFDLRKGELNPRLLSVVKENNLDDSYTYAHDLYSVLYDEDDENFIENVKAHYGDVMNLQKKDLLVCCIHYGHQYSSLKLSDVFPNSSIIHFCTDSVRHTRYFNLLFQYKNQSDRADNIFQDDTLSEKKLKYDIVQPAKLRCFDDKAIPFNVGNAVFNRDLSEIDRVEASLEKELSIPVRLDRKAWIDYSNLNIQIIESILGAGFEELSSEEQVNRSLSYLKNNIRVKVPQ